jgi:hypothetical protein
MNIKYILLGILMAGFFTACEEGDSVEIITLGKAGDYFYFGEKVPVWAGVEGDLNEISYDWECTGGRFDGWRTQHLFENLWIAPTEAGEYIVTVTAKNGGKSDSRQTKMKVVNYFSENFEYGSKNPAGWASSNTTLEYGTNPKDPKDMLVYVPSTSNTADPQFRRTLTGTPLFPPFSIRTKIMYTGYKTVTNITSGNSATFLSIFFVQPTENTDKPYIREIRWEFCPPATGTNLNWRLRMESFLPATGKSIWATDAGNNNPVPAPFLQTIQGRNELFNFSANQYHTFAMTVDADWNFSAYADGNAFVTKSDVLKKFVTINGLNHLDMQVREFRLTTPRKSSSGASNQEVRWAVSQVEINDAHSAIGGDVNNIGFEELK